MPEARKLTVKGLKKILANPFYCINIHPSLFAKHRPLVDKKTWVKANVRGIKEEGAKEWLERLLSVLEGDYLANEDSEKGSEESA